MTAHLDLDGQYSYSSTIGVDVAVEAGSMSLFPNPVSQRLNVRIGDVEGRTYRVVNSMGAVMLEGSLVNGQDINVEQLATGTYTISVYGKNQPVTRRFVKR